MSSWFYQSASVGSSSSAFSDQNTETPDSSWQQSPSSSAAQTTFDNSPPSTVGFASFTCHVAFLEDKLHTGRGGKSAFFADVESKTVETRVPAGEGGFFVVDKAKLKGNSVAAAGGKDVVALKTVKDQLGNPSAWRDILLEVRALLHEPLRYHPSIVKLLDIGWRASAETGATFPTLVLEYADFGTFYHLQHQKKALPFSIKQKLCYDVGRGLSILHACNIVHGDLKHENVLIFKNTSDYPPHQPYIAKLADFGGSVMDMHGSEDQHRLHMGTIPWSAPEVGRTLTADEIKSTDVYSFGLLVWRAFIDCRDPLVSIGFRDTSVSLSEDEIRRLKELKSSESFLQKAAESAQSHAQNLALPNEALEMIVYVLLVTIQVDPSSRSLVHAQARLRGISAETVQTYIAVKDAENQKKLDQERSEAPGSHGISVDSAGFFLARDRGDAYDVQDNLPGYRPDIGHPNLGGFLFDPIKLKGIIDWSQQVTMVQELKRLASLPFNERSTEIQPWLAAFDLFKAHLTGFGCEVSLEEACTWLHKASKSDVEAADVDYLAQAWLVRFCTATNVPTPLPINEQIQYLKLSISRGHLHCREDIAATARLMASPQEAQSARDTMDGAFRFYRLATGATGMPHYVPRNLKRDYELSDLDALDADIRLDLGDEYLSCLRGPCDDLRAPPPSGDHRFDKIYVNKKGHGLLHYAATFGDVRALEHMYRKYKCNIDLANQSVGDTPLVCACRSGHLDCALFLLDNGANPDGHDTGEEAPLHWISNFGGHEVGLITQRLVQAGANVSRICGCMRKDVRSIIADWEDRLSLPLTPLGRAVLMKSMPAVRALLQIARADPHEKSLRDMRQMNLSAVRLASILTLPDFLSELLLYQDNTSPNRQYGVLLLDEDEMLETARSLPSRDMADPLTLQSRIVRCGVEYQDCLTRTLWILQEHRVAKQPDYSASQDFLEDISKCMCIEVGRGNLDIVQALLDIGHTANGVPGRRPLAAAVKVNDARIFELLLAHGAELTLGDGEETLLQAFASKPRTSPYKLDLARFLIESNVPVEAARGDKPSPLCLAIKNGYFDLADLLIAHGAGGSINDYYQWTKEGSFMSVLGALLTSQTFSSLLGVNYLAAKHKQGILHVQPLVDLSRELSALHILALEEPERMNPRQQVSARIIHRVIEMFPTPKSLESHAVHEEYGTPISAAVVKTNDAVLSALLESEHRTSILTLVMIPAIQQPLGINDNISALVLNFLQIGHYIQKFQIQGSLSPEDMQQMKRIERLGRMLMDMVSQMPDPNQGPSSTQAEGRTKWEEDVAGLSIMFGRLASKVKELEQQAAAVDSLSGLSLGSASTNPSSNPDMPVQLSQMTKDEPKNWWDKREIRY